MADYKNVTTLQAEEGLKLMMKAQDAAGAEYDVKAAEAFKLEIETKMADLEKEVAALTGKDNKKARSQKSKEVSELKTGQKFVDACKVAKGLEAKFGNFVLKAAEVVVDAPVVEEAKPAEEDAKKETKQKEPKKAQSTGISKDERDELEGLKTKIVERKSLLKEQGLSGGQQNKDEEVGKMVARMNELKEKQDPGSTQKKTEDTKKGGKKKGSLTADDQKELQKLQVEVEEYRAKLKTEFGYSNKDIKADPDLKEMELKIAQMEKRN